MGIAHLDEVRANEFDLGHLRGRWSFLGEAAGSVKVGARRIELPAGAWSTPLHEHGRAEESFYVLSGKGLSLQGTTSSAIAAGDCIIYPPRRGAHTLHALEPLDVLAFGPREYDESIGFPRLEMSLVATRTTATSPAAIDGAPFQFVREAKLGAPELPDESAARPGTIVHLDDVEAVRMERTSVVRTRRNLGRAAGSVMTGLQHVEVAPGKHSSPQHCHSEEEEMFVILDGEGTLLLDDERTPVRRGHVIARPAGSGKSHSFQAGQGGLTYLAYGTREPGDICYYPRSNKIAFRGVGVIARLEQLEYWDGED